MIKLIINQCNKYKIFTVDLSDELIRHYLIEPSMRGVRLKGCANEPVFGSLSALIYQHSITSIALPCKLIIPSSSKWLTII